MRSEPTQLLSVSRAAMTLPKGPAPVERIECESANETPLLADDDLPNDVVGVPLGAFVLT